MAYNAWYDDDGEEEVRNAVVEPGKGARERARAARARTRVQKDIELIKRAVPAGRYRTALIEKALEDDLRRLATRERQARWRERQARGLVGQPLLVGFEAGKRRPGRPRKVRELSAEDMARANRIKRRAGEIVEGGPGWVLTAEDTERLKPLAGKLWRAK